jgi:hypothetical protein
LAPFYDLSEKDRIALTQQAIEQRRTVIERWSGLAKTETHTWSARAAEAAKLLAMHTGVADMGCGTMTLEQHLPAATKYYPVDVVARDQRTVVCDFNDQPPPATEASAVACLGLLEYLFDVPQFLRQLAQIYAACAVSYNPLKASDSIELRRSHAWVSDYSLEALEAEFVRAGWRIISSKPLAGGQILWSLQSALSV